MSKDKPKQAKRTAASLDALTRAPKGGNVELTEAELQQIRAYIIQQLWASYDAEQRGTELGPQ